MANHNERTDQCASRKSSRHGKRENGRTSENETVMRGQSVLRSSTTSTRTLSAEWHTIDYSNESIDYSPISINEWLCRVLLSCIFSC